MRKLIGAIDQGTSSSRFIIFDLEGRIVSMAQKRHAQICARPGWVEHDPLEILDNTCQTIVQALSRADLAPGDLAAVGIANQRETTLLWDRRSGKPLHNAIVWQDARVEPLVAEFAADGGQDRFRAKTGLPLASYFSSLKLKWLLDNVEGARAKARAGDALFGTMDSWLLWNLTGGASGGIHLTDVTNASRTQLMRLDTCAWDAALLSAFDIPPACLPTIAPSAGVYAEARAEALAGAPLAAILGDQQAALVGQTCFSTGDAKNTYGTGCFMLMNTGETPCFSKFGLLTTLAYQFGDDRPRYALEGAIAVAGSLVQWLRDKLRLFDAAGEIEALARTVPDNGDVYIVPAFSGLYAPYWKRNARGVIVGLTHFASAEHLARAALEAVACQVRDVAEAMQADSGVAITRLRADGGMVENDLLMQFQADILDAPVVRPQVAETTALGAAYAAGLAVGCWPDLATLSANWRAEREWRPSMSTEARAHLYGRWKKAVERSFDWAE